MNTFGRLFRFSIYGESHGSEVGVLIDGCPAGLALAEVDFQDDLDRRRAGGVGKTKRIESDRIIIRSGVFNGKTTGAPLLIGFENANVDSTGYESRKDTPRPGHADFTADKKFGGHNDYRGGGHFSGRLTVGLVAAGVVAKKIISPVKVSAGILEVGGKANYEEVLNKAIENGDSLGGIVECIASNVPIGWGEPFFDSAESAISHIVFAIPAIKGIEFGAGFQCVKMTGSQCNDSIEELSGKTKTNHAGGISGGITNGNDLVFRVAVKPTPSISVPQNTINLKTGQLEQIKVTGRHDACISLRMPVILESACAIVLADFALIAKGMKPY